MREDAAVEWTRPLRVLAVRYSQGDDVSVGIVHSDGDGVLLVLVSGVVIRPSLQEETHQPATAKSRNRKLTNGALCNRFVSKSMFLEMD